MVRWGWLWLWVAVSCCGLGVHGLGQADKAGPAVYTPMVWDIDWTYLQRAGAARDWTDGWHYVRLGEAPGRYVSVTGQVRERGEYQDHPAFGAQPGDNGYLLERFLVSGDVHVGERFRGFLQLESGLEYGRDGGPRPGIDEDKLDVNQGFVEVTPWRKGESSVTVRAGRQLVGLGSTRLVATGVGLNVEQPFDGFRVTWRQAGWTVEGLALRPVVTKTGFFDDVPNSAEELWGVYASHGLPGWKASVDGYYLGFDRKQARYTQGTGREQRETVGARVWAHTPTWDYDFEGTGQFGRFGAGKIRAWGAGYHLGYRFAGRRFQPMPEIDGGVLSGDHDAKDGTLGTFNPLFPNGNYLSESILVGPYNLVITRPTVKLALTRKLTSNTNLELLWRQAREDGVYNIVGILTHPAAGSGFGAEARYIGTQVQEEVGYSFTRHLSGALAYEHFFVGSFLKQSPPGKGLNFVSPQLTWNF